MTAITMMVQRAAQRGVILSDCAVTTPEGVLVGSVSKVVRGAAFPWAFAMTGNLLPEAILATALTDPTRTADAAAFSRALPDALRQMVEQTAFKLRIPMAAIMTQAVGVMWDQAEQRLVGFFVTTHSGALMGRNVRPFTWYETEWTCGPTTPGGVEEMMGRPVDLCDPASFDPEFDGVTLAEAQRRAAAPSLVPGVSAPVPVGVELDMTFVEPSGVTVWAIHQWPDRVGEPIRPQ